MDQVPNFNISDDEIFAFIIGQLAVTRHKEVVDVLLRFSRTCLTGEKLRVIEDLCNRFYEKIDG